MEYRVPGTYLGIDIGTGSLSDACLELNVTIPGAVDQRLPQWNRVTAVTQPT
jgi:hypothetical protein